VKIALVILNGNPARGGAERYTADLAAALAQRGHDVSLIASTVGAPIPGVREVYLEIYGFTRTGRYKKFLDAVDQHLDEERYDIVHAMLPIKRCDLYHPHAGVARDALRKRSSLFNPRRWSMASVEADLLVRPDRPRVIALSDYVKAQILNAYPALPPERIVKLFNAVNLERFEPAPPPEIPRKEINALIIANDFERKGVLQTIRAVERVDDRRLNLDIVGRGDIDESTIRWPIRIWGEVPDPREFYRKADFFVLPTRHDPCSLVVLEALAMGLPVISTRFNGATEIMTDGVHGYILDDPDNIDAIADAMRKMLEPDRRAAMREACLALRPQLAYDRHLERLLEIYRPVAAAK
jgi:UDP-glucose:(heptosyl)LPS alpha-1,3-glucosyltransferase